MTLRTSADDKPSTEISVSPYAKSRDPSDNTPKIEKSSGGSRTLTGLSLREEQKILGRMRKRFKKCESMESKNRKNFTSDLKFKGGEQWSPDTAQKKMADGEPLLTINKLPVFVNQIVNDCRQNRPAINISPIGNKSDKEAAKILKGMIRFIERNSKADIAYDTGLEYAVSTGIGYWRIVADYESGDSFNQCLYIKRIANILSVRLDPDRAEPDGSDARFGFIEFVMSEEEFKEEYPDASLATNSDWISGDGYAKTPNKADKYIRGVEYYEIECDTKRLVALNNGHIGFYDDLSDEVKQKIKDGSLTILKERKAEQFKQMYYKAISNQILEKKEWPGRYIPIIQVTGSELNINGVTDYSGVIRFAKDPMKMYNYWATKETASIAGAPRPPYIMEEGQIEGHEEAWRNANTTSTPVLLYKGVDLAGRPAPPPQRQPFPEIPAGAVNAKNAAAQDIMGTTGVRFDATSNERMYDESGKAIKELRRSTDITNFHYSDNLCRSLRHTGDVLIDLIPHYYDTEQVMTILREDDSEEIVRLDPYAGKAYGEEKNEDGKTQKIFNPNIGKYSVAVTIGPSFATKRIEAAHEQMEFARALPNVAAAIPDLIVKNQDWDGAEEMATRLAKTLSPNLLTPEQKDVPPQVQALLSSQQAQIQQFQQQIHQMQTALNDNQANRNVLLDKNAKDYEVKLLQILQKTEADQLKRDTDLQIHLNETIGRKIEEATKKNEEFQQLVLQALRPPQPEQQQENSPNGVSRPAMKGSNNASSPTNDAGIEPQANAE